MFDPYKKEELFKAVSTIVCSVTNVYNLYFEFDSDGQIVGLSPNREIHHLFELFKKFYYKGKKQIGVSKQLRMSDFNNIDNEKFCSIMEDILKIEE